MQVKPWEVVAYSSRMMAGWAERLASILLHPKPLELWTPVCLQVQILIFHTAMPFPVAKSLCQAWIVGIWGGREPFTTAASLCASSSTGQPMAVTLTQHQLLQVYPRLGSDEGCVMLHDLDPGVDRLHHG